METCKHGLGAGIRKPTAEMRQGAGCRAYDLQKRYLLYIPTCSGTAEQTVFRFIYYTNLLSRVGELPFTLYGRLEIRSAGPAPGTDCQCKNPAHQNDFTTALLGNDR